MITVEYLPSGEDSPFPDPKVNVWQFHDYDSFKKWVQGYVCVHCLIDFEDWSGRRPRTLKDWLDMGCGCEITVDDDNGLIDWEDTMEYTPAYETAREEYLKEKNG